MGLTPRQVLTEEEIGEISQRLEDEISQIERDLGRATEQHCRLNHLLERATHARKLLRIHTSWQPNKDSLDGVIEYLLEVYNKGRVIEDAKARVSQWRIKVIQEKLDWLES